MTPAHLGHRAKRFIYKLAMGKLLVTGGDPASRSVYLTFDDGPHPQNTERILDILESTGARATFFLLGTELEKYPEVGRRYIQAGHAVANHGFHHERHRYLDRRSVEREFFRNQVIIEKTCGVRPTVFRPPYGTLNPAVASFSVRNRIAVMLWSVDSDDDRSKDNGTILASLENVGDGDIVLFHEDCFQTTEILRNWILRMKDSGIRFVSTCHNE